MTTEKIKTKEDITKSISLLKSLKFRIPTWTIDVIKFQTFKCLFLEEMFSQRLGQILLMQKDIIFTEKNFEKNEVIYSVKATKLCVNGPGWIKSKHINLPCANPHEKIIFLREGDSIECDIYIGKSVGKIHPKWSPVVKARYNKNSILYNNLDIMTSDQIEICARRNMGNMTFDFFYS